jgi:hypothetical protein
MNARIKARDHNDRSTNGMNGVTQRDGSVAVDANREQQHPEIRRDARELLEAALGAERPR